jgi:acyl dehydratase
MGAELGMVFSGTAIAYLEHSARFIAPVFIGDRLDIVWTVTALEPKPRAGGGIVVLQGTATNQHGRVVCDADGKMLVGGT